MTERVRTHPAVSLRESLEATGWSVNEFAARLGVSRIAASRLLNERTCITPDVALALERIGWSTADFWLRRQASYELSVAHRRMEEDTTDANPYKGAVLPPDAVE
jgi:addiction module HigA family antidote